MKMINCKNCGCKIYYKAKICTNCKKKQNNNLPKFIFLGVIIFVLLFAFLLVYLAFPKKEEQTITKNDNAIYKKLSLNSLLQIFEKMNDQIFIEKKINELNFKKRFEDIFISKSMITEKKPKQWIHLTQPFQQISFMTIYKKEWKSIVVEIENRFGAFELLKGSVEESNVFIIKKCISNNYKFTIEEPINGVNIASNNLYTIFISKP